MGVGAKHTTMEGDGATLLAEYNEVDPQYEGVSYWGPEPVPFDKFSVLRLYNYGGVESRYPLIWYGQSVGRPSTTFSPLPAGETDVVVMSPYPNGEPAIYDAPLSLWDEGLHEVDVWCCANPASFSSIKFGLYDGPHEWCRDGTLRAEWTVPAEDGVWKRTRLRWLNAVGPVEGYLRMTCVYAVSWQTFAFGYREVVQPQGPFGLSGPRINAAVSRTPITLPSWER